MIAASRKTKEPFPAGTEAQIEEFTELVATAIANAQAREELRTLAEEQATLRRVATLAARGVRPVEIFSAVSDEVGRLFGSEQAAVGRFEPDGSAVVVVGVSGGIRGVSIGTRWELEDFLASTAVYRTGRPARNESRGFQNASGPVADSIRKMGVVSTVAAPIVVEGNLWGVMTVSDVRERLPPDAEERVEKFTELVATAIANAQAHTELMASRARIVATADQIRRRIERDLHDGAQQRLVSLALQLRGAAAAIPPEQDEVHQELASVGTELDGVLDDLRELSRGVHPAILSQGGLGPALRTLARRCSVPVQLQLGMEGKLPERVEVAAYYVVAEALTNVAKHANASLVQVEVAIDDGLVRLGVRDDGVGGADPARGSGLAGLKDRVAATGGTLRVQSHPGQGTSLVVELPIDAGQPPGSA